jgi:CrcB protein
MLENVVGSFLLGILTGFVLERKIPEHWKHGIGVGFCGSFTTMSTFAADTYSLFQQGTFLSLLLYVHVSLLGGLTLALIGMITGKRLGTKRVKVMRP